MYRDSKAALTTVWEELAYRLREAGLDEFHGSTGWVHCEPFHTYFSDYRMDRWGVRIKTPHGATCVTALPYDTVDNLWTRFEQEIEPLRQFGFFQRNRLQDVRKTTEAPDSLALEQTTPIPETVSEVCQVIATTAGYNGRALVDPVIHRRCPGASYLERFRRYAESIGMRGATVEVRSLLLKGG
jgi:hypothetical protein